MRILFCHNNFPGQFRRLAPAFADEGHDVVFVHKSIEWHATSPDGFRLLSYTPHRGSAAEALHPYLRRFDAAVIEGQAVYRVCEGLKNEGWCPDVVISHAGFGNGLYLADVFPRARRFVLAEWFYNAEGADVDFLHRNPVDSDRRLRLRTWNAQTLLEVAGCQSIVSPTFWQKQQFPLNIQSCIEVIHEGIDWKGLQLIRTKSFPLPCGLELPRDAEIMTYVSRGFEEYRGFPQVMQAVSVLQKQRPKLQVLIAGADVVAYGSGRADGRSWKTWAQEELRLDIHRTHWLGSLQDQDYRSVLAHSHVHFYLTVPFVLSWSLLEAMAAGCSIVASDTAPVKEVLTHDENALLVDFFDVQAQVRALNALLDDREKASRYAAAAVQAAKSFDAEYGIESWRTLLSVDKR